MSDTRVKRVFIFIPLRAPRGHFEAPVLRGPSRRALLVKLLLGPELGEYIQGVGVKAPDSRDHVANTQCEAVRRQIPLNSSPHEPNTHHPLQ